MIYTADIFRLADLLIEAGYFPKLEGKVYCLILRETGTECWTIHRRQASCVLPKSYRVWLVKGRTQCLLGDSDALPADLSAGVSPPFLG